MININERVTADFLAFVNSLKEGEAVIETGNTCMNGKRGVVYFNTNPGTAGSVCVKWEGGMGTSVTWGTRRVNDVSAHQPTD